MQHRDRVAAEVIQRGFAAGIRDLRDAGELGRGSAAVFGVGVVEYAPQAVGTDDHRNAAFAEFDDVVLGPTVIAIIRREADVAVFGPSLAAIAAHQHAVPRIAHVV